jgi:uncharacterized protein with HEPN domain
MRNPAEDDPAFLNDILDCINNIKTYTQAGEAEFFQSRLIRDAVARNFEIIGEATKRLSPELRQQYPIVPWRRMAGFRDVLIHSYMDIDIPRVWEAVQEIEHLTVNLETILQTITSAKTQDS